ncbi:MAG: nitroreductase [Hyphomicrobiaceae bacterium]
MTSADTPETGVESWRKRPEERTHMTVEEAIRGRQSIRGFLKTPVPRDLIKRVLETAGRAPSGTNIQPWKIYVLDGRVRDEVTARMCKSYDTEPEPAREYNYYPMKWREPYIGRRRACGWGLYGTLGITRENKDGMHQQRRQNFEFFGAPTGLIFTIDRDMEVGSWLDTGMFIQSVMVAARQFGLETCPQAAIANYHELLTRCLGIPGTEQVVCGMALGYPDPEAVVNTFRTEREPVDVIATFVDDLKA